MKQCLPLIVVGYLAVLGADARGPEAGEKPARVYVAPYGLTRADLGDAAAPNFRHAVLGEGSQAEQEAAIKVLASDRKKTGRELGSVGGHFRGKLKGVQAVVWRDIGRGKYKRAGGRTRFNPEADRIEVVFTRCDLTAVQAMPKDSPNAPTAGSEEWVAMLVQADKKRPKNYRAGQGLAGGLGGSGDFKSGNIFPVSRNAEGKVGEMQSFLVGLIRSAEVTPGQPPPAYCMLIAFKYPDGRSHIPSHIQYYWALGESAWGGRMVDNK